MRVRPSASESSATSSRLPSCAETTIITQSGNSSKDATLYVTASPCMECAKLIIQAGIKRVVYRDAYRLTDGIDLLTRAGIEVEQVD